jgi:hypothetical protein
MLDPDRRLAGVIERRTLQREIAANRRSDIGQTTILESLSDGERQDAL